MTLEELVARLGLSVVARRVGVSTATLRRWLRDGPSLAGVDRLRVVTRRHLGSKKAAQTRAAKFRTRLPLPVNPAVDLNNPIGSGNLSVEDVLPTHKPRTKPTHVFDGSVYSYETDRYSGWNNWVTVGKPLVDVDNEMLFNEVLSIWQRSSEMFVFVEFLFFRYIPFNPIYKGEMLAKQGRWFEFTTQSPVRATQAEVIAGIEEAVDNARIAAEYRLIWLEAINVKTIDER